MANIINGIKYTEEHEWVSVEGNVATIGISDFAQSSLGDIVFVETPDVDDEIEKGGNFGVVESIKSVTDLVCPISGKVIEVNEELADSPEECNSNPYEAWFMKVELSDISELDILMSADSYKEYCESQK